MRFGLPPRAKDRRSVAGELCALLEGGKAAVRRRKRRSSRDRPKGSRVAAEGGRVGGRRTPTAAPPRPLKTPQKIDLEGPD